MQSYVYQKKAKEQIPDFSTFRRVFKSSRGTGGIYTEFDEMSVVIVTHDGRLLMPRMVYTYLGKPVYVRALENDSGWVGFAASNDPLDFKVQGNRGGKRGIATVDCLTLTKSMGMCRKNFKSIYEAVLYEGEVYVNTLKQPLRLIEHKVTSRGG